MGAFQDQGSIFLKRYILKIRMCIKKFYTLFRLHFILKLLKNDIYHNLKILSVVSSLYYFKTLSHYNVYKYKKKVKLTFLCCTLARRELKWGFYFIPYILKAESLSYLFWLVVVLLFCCFFYCKFRVKPEFNHSGFFGVFFTLDHSIF